MASAEFDFNKALEKYKNTTRKQPTPFKSKFTFDFIKYAAFKLFDEIELKRLQSIVDTEFFVIGLSYFYYSKFFETNKARMFIETEHMPYMDQILDNLEHIFLVSPEDIEKYFNRANTRVIFYAKFVINNVLEQKQKNEEEDDSKVKIRRYQLSSEQTRDLADLVIDGVINLTQAKAIIKDVGSYDVTKHTQNILEYCICNNIFQITDEDVIARICEQIISENQDVVKSYKAGKTASLNVLSGKIIKFSENCVNMEIANKVLLGLLS